MKIILSDDTVLSREEWLRERGSREEYVMRDGGGEYIVDVVEIEPHEPGGVYERKIYLPRNIQLC